MIRKEVIKTKGTSIPNPGRGMGHVSLLLVMLLTFVFFQPGFAGEYADKFIRTAGLKGESVAVKVIDLKTGKVLESHNSDKALTPASIMKCVSIATLSDALPMDYRYQTRVYMTGNIASGVLRGNLLVVGSGDPTLNSRSTPKSSDIIKEILTALKKRGIEKISGKIEIDQDIFKGPAQPSGWGRGDLDQSYGAGCFGFNFENNSRGDASVADPAAVFRTRLENALRSTGIVLEGRDMADGHNKLLLNHKSAPLDEICAAA